MTKTSMLMLAAALIAASIASPALAQSFNPRDGTGNVMPLQYQGTDGGRTAWTMTPRNERANVQVAARKSNSQQVAAHHGGPVERIAGHRLAHRGTA
jgi:hypothetical protein